MKFFTKFIVFFIWFAAIFDPIGNVFGLRYLAMCFFLINVALIPIFIKIRFVDVYWRGTFILVLSVIMPLYGYLIYLFHTRGGDFIDTSYLASGLLILYSLLYCSKDITESALRIMIFVLRILVFVIIFSALFQFQNYSDPINFFTERNVAIIGFRNYAGIQFPYIYFLASPLLIFLLVYDFDRIVNNFSFLNFIFFFFSSVALVLSGTRAHMLMPFLIIPIYYLFRISLVKKLYYLPGVILFFIVCLLNDSFFNLLAEFFSTKEASNQAKISMLSGYVEIFSNPFTFLFGQGYNAHEWCSVLRTMIVMEDKASKTELTYIEILRVYGVFFFTLFIFMLYFLLKKLKSFSNYYWLYLSFTLYLLNSSINPYLFSTNGMLPFGIVLAVVYFESRNTRLSNIESE